MALTAGTRLGPYEIVDAIGAGGIGEVYRARDTKLDREVAIKVLPELFVSDPEHGKRPIEATAAPASGGRTSPLALTAWIVAALLAAIGSGALWIALRRSPAPAPRVVRLVSPLPVANVGGALVNGGMALSRDGSRLAFVGGPRQQIHVRAMDQFDATALAGTNGASFLSFSPDGQAISYISREGSTSRLKRVSAAGGPSQTLAEAASFVAPATQSWATTDDIYYTNNGLLMRIWSTGGKPERLAKPDPQRGEASYVGPQLLPDGQRVLVSLYAVLALLASRASETSRHSGAISQFDQSSSQGCCRRTSPAGCTRRFSIVRQPTMAPS